MSTYKAGGCVCGYCEVCNPDIYQTKSGAPSWCPSCKALREEVKEARQDATELVQQLAQSQAQNKVMQAVVDAGYILAMRILQSDLTLDGEELAARDIFIALTNKEVGNYEI